ncbi:putative protein Brevis radix-like 5 [Triticum dicoccoides]|uniref:putative protein Brevis radix-like 5 n=1 Tax=Triticum dicoccoides TaxID=85692 RepID=UPI00188FFE91|nr:putative protein Brevis radix-like 5 [Triticum dicoccoides]
MHACFHGGGGGGSGRTKTISIIRDLTKNMKSMSLKMKAGGGGGNARARRRRRKGAEGEEDLEPQDKDVAAASASAKIAPEEREGKTRAPCDRCRSGLEDVPEEGGEEEAAAAADHTTGEEQSDGEWVAEPEPGVLMTLVSRPDGTNHLRKLRFREELFDGPRAAQRWWADNYDSIVELYSIVQSTGWSHEEEDAEDGIDDDEPATPCQSEDDHHQPRRWPRLGCDSASTSAGPSSGSGSGSGSGGGSASTVGSPILGLVVATPPNNSGSRGERGPGQAQSHKHKCRSLHIN